MRFSVHHSLRSVGTALVGLAVVLWLALVAAVSPATAELEWTHSPASLAPADTDSVALAIDSTRFDTLASDTTVADTNRVARYFSGFKMDRPTARVRPRTTRPFSTKLGAYWRHSAVLDSLQLRYTIRETIGDDDVRHPLTLDLQAYQKLRLQESIRASWGQLSARQQRRQQRARRGIGFNIAVPGGENSLFTTIFGKNEVDLNVSGSADLDLGLQYQESDQQAAISGSGSRLDPKFGQNLRLNITGTIGDKLRVNVSWDTESQFDFENRLKLEYTGYEDEIIQKIEAGNVFLQTPSSLIQGGQSLFGIRSEFQFGKLRLTAVASQQKGQSNELVLDGGSTTNEFSLNASAYEDNTHFFFGFYFRNHWNEALSNPPYLNIGNLDRITDIEVWKLQQSTQTQENERRVIALLDLAETPAVLPNGLDATLPLPNPDLDRYDTADLDQLRDGNAAVDGYLQNTLGVTPAAYKEGKFRKLERGRDYEFDPLLGYITLRGRLTENEALAVAYRFVTRDQRVVEVGDFATGGGDDGTITADRLVLKLLRPDNPDPRNKAAAWDLTLRNIYSTGKRSISPDDFELTIQYEPPAQPPSQTLPGITIPGLSSLLQMLGFDRLDEDESPRPDNRFDFTGLTIDQQNGRLIFPYLEPFGDRISDLIDQSAVANPTEAKDLFVYRTLYDEKQTEAVKDTQHDVYIISGEFSGGVQSTFELGFFNVVEGSVRVTVDGIELQEGTDYSVQGSFLTITNPQYLTPGRQVRISYENPELVGGIQKKSLVGLRADYEVSEQLLLGATLMRLSEKPVVDKFRIGEEPITNTIWGVDGSYRAEPRWLTRAVDALPLIQTKAPSLFSVKGEFAQLLPGHARTIAFERRQDRLRNIGRDFKDEERNGEVSFLDDFEAVQVPFTLDQAGSWQISAVPDSIGAVPNASDFSLGLETANRQRMNWRGGFSWYRILENTERELGIPVDNRPETRRIHKNEVFPNKDVSGETPASRLFFPFDLYFNPSERGPYNFAPDLQQFKAEPEKAWGGMVQRIPEGYTDFSQQNIEFVEFLVSVHPEGTDVETQNAKLYVDLGTISEDIIPNGILNTEDGLLTRNIEQSTFDEWGRLTDGITNGAIEIEDNPRFTEDLGLDGLPSSNIPVSYVFNINGQDSSLTEQAFYADFLAGVRQQFGENSPEYQRALNDPAADDYHHFDDGSYFENAQFFPNAVSVQQRFSRFFNAPELNTYEAQRQVLNSDRSGNSRTPDSEDLNLNGSADSENSYFQYEVPLHVPTMDHLAQRENTDDYIVERIENPNSISGVSQNSAWYLVRIPVREFTRRAGTIENFTSIQYIRVWTTGHQRPMTMRFAKFELIGNQWQKSTAIGNDAPESSLTISTINNEENASRYRVPDEAIISQILSTTTTQRQDSREQAMVLRVENLAPGKERAIFKTYQQHLDLLRYDFLRMFMHLEGTKEGGQLLNRGDMRVFVRIGQSETQNFYEYTQPLTPYDDPVDLNDPAAADSLWQTRVPAPDGSFRDINSMNVDLASFNKLKLTRDQQAVPLNETFYDTLNGATYPPGTRIGIRGNPSLGRVTNVTMGIRNDSTNVEVLEDVTVWFNELRVAGYDEKSGWAAIVSANLHLADFAQIDANLRRQTDGFGGLSSTLAERGSDNTFSWAVSTNLNLHKFIPDRFNWSVPYSISFRSSEATPRFSPTRGDIRVETIVAQINEDENKTAAEKSEEIQDVRTSAQTTSFTRTQSVSVSKSSSKSKILRYLVDPLSLSYSHSQNEASNPSTRLNDGWDWSTRAQYTLQFPRGKTFRPFGFLEKVPVLKQISGLRMSYMPESVGLSATLDRNFTQSQDRFRFEADTDSLRFEQISQFPFRENHRFNHRRTFDFQYNPFTFLSFNFGSETAQNLNSLGLITRDSLAVVDTSGALHVFEGLTYDDGGIDTLAVARHFAFQRLHPRSFNEVTRDIFNGTGQIRNERYSENYAFTFRPQLNKIKGLNWLVIQPVSYRSNFSWQNGPIPRDGELEVGAAISTDLTIRGGMQFKPVELWRKFGFYRKIEEAQAEADQIKQQRQRARDQHQQARDTAREQFEDEQLRRQEVADARLAALIEQGFDPENLPDSLQAEVEVPEATFTFPEDTTSGGSWFDPVGLLRKTVLAVTGLRDLSVTYNGQRTSASGNVQEGGFNLIDAIAGDARTPSLGYRLGLSRTIGTDVRVEDPDDRLQISDSFRDSDQLGIKTRLALSQKLSVDLSWDARWEDNREVSFRRDPTDPSILLPLRTESGSNRTTTWAFGASYADLFNRQFARYEANLDPSNPDTLRSQDGTPAVLTNAALATDFRSSFVRTTRTGSGNGLMPFPLPNWNINYAGLADLPIFRSLFTSATLRHNYSATYEVDSKTNLAAGEEKTFKLDEKTVAYPVSELEVGTIRINENYSPLLGLDLTWKGNIRTNMQWKKSNSYAMTATNADINANFTNEFSLTTNVTKQNMKLRFLGREFNNTLQFTLTVSFSRKREIRYRLQNDLELALRGLTDPAPDPDPNAEETSTEGFLTGSLIDAGTTLTIKPQLTYTFSNRVTADLFFSYENRTSENSRLPTITTMDGGFKIRLSFSQ